MDILYHRQFKQIPKDNGSASSDIIVEEEDDKIIINAKYQFNYIKRYDKKTNITYHHKLTIDLIKGNFMIENETLVVSDGGFVKNHIIKKNKKNINNFKILKHTCELGLTRGESRINYWGVKHKNFLIKLYNYILSKVQFKSPYFKKLHTDIDLDTMYYYDKFFILVVNIFMDRKNIKVHNQVYKDILVCVPKKKYLKTNDHKFLPSLLDELQLKSKYLISNLSELNNIDILTLNFLCKLFGSSYIDYLKKINWKESCLTVLTGRKTYELKNTYEKNCLVKVFQNWMKTANFDHPHEDGYPHLLWLIQEMMKTRKFIESKGVKTKFNCKNREDLYILKSIWDGHSNHFKKGYKLKYEYSDDLLDSLHEIIEFEGKSYTPKVLQSEEDFIVEGIRMKNCMGNNFNMGLHSFFITINSLKTRVNVQYNFNGDVMQSFGKSNSKTPENFYKIINIISKKLKNQGPIEKSLVRYDFLIK